MSPLARSLLALACAALLRAACAQTVCNSDTLGVRQGTEIVLPLVPLPPNAGQELNYEIKDNCAMRYMTLHGVAATVCDWSAPPAVKVVSGGRAVHVLRYGPPPASSALLEVRQYCGWY